LPAVIIIINPRAGVGGLDAVAARTTLARDLLERFGMDGEVVVTEHRGHGGEVTRAMVGKGVAAVVAWGGDGTINEVASELVNRAIPLGIVPAGSGNGLARELRIEWDPRRALETALKGRVRQIDAGELGGRHFFNVAGIGLDAHLADVFDKGTQRGIRGYVAALFRELGDYDPVRYLVQTSDAPESGSSFGQRALLVALANSRQYGNRAVIAPTARFDDGLLELVIVPPLSLAATLWHARRLFTGTVHRIPKVVTRSVRAGKISADRPLTFHVDGEVVEGPDRLSFGVHPEGLWVRVPT
jgi:YegS/Rv2252/BmrU family lipid kinase